MLKDEATGPRFLSLFRAVRAVGVVAHAGWKWLENVWNMAGKRMEHGWKMVESCDWKIVGFCGARKCSNGKWLENLMDDDSSCPLETYGEAIGKCWPSSDAGEW